MPELPILLFPEPKSADLGRLHGRGRKITIPDSSRQGGRLTPQFQRLQSAMNSRRLMLQDNPLGIQPEQVLVLETIGSEENFIKAVRKVGLEWLGELNIEDIKPSDGFQDSEDAERTLKGQLYLIFTDQRALAELQSLFENWQRNPEGKFPLGLAPLKNAFTHLKSVRPWDAEDRIRDTGITEDWNARIEHGQAVVPFEAELWFREREDRRAQAERYFGVLVEELGGEIVSRSVIPEIAYHGVLGRIPVEQIAEVTRISEIRLLRCDDIMHLRPVGQCTIRNRGESRETSELTDLDARERPYGQPVIALFDGLPLARHQLLDGRVIIDDPDDYEGDYQSTEREHGTAMASIICHGDLNERNQPIETPLYVRPIMKPSRDFDGNSVEVIPEDELPIDIVHRAVRRLFETEGETQPVAPDVKIINLSIGDRGRPFDRAMSPWARLLDWLSWKYNVLFVVSAGNHLHEIELNIPRLNLGGLKPLDREKAIIAALAADTRHRRLLSPGETFNGVTLAATHSDSSTPALNNFIIDPFSNDQLPSAVSAHGPGYRRSIKPDILLPGGRQFLREKLGTTHANATLQLLNSANPPGLQVATPGPTGELNRTCYTRGTSNSTALATRWCSQLLNLIEQLRAENPDELPDEYDAVLTKALLVHGADWSDARSIFETAVQSPSNGNIREYIGRFLGYGAANPSRVISCTNQRVTIIGVGKLREGEGHEFSFPLPPCLSAVTEKRRLTVTLAWFTPTAATRHKYRKAHLWFDPRNVIAPTRICADHRAAQRGTVQHEILEGDRAVDYQDGDSIAVKISCRDDAGDFTDAIRYGLAVTLEVAEGIEIPVYQEVRERLRVRIPIIGSPSAS